MQFNLEELYALILFLVTEVEGSQALGGPVHVAELEDVQ